MNDASSAQQGYITDHLANVDKSLLRDRTTAPCVGIVYKNYAPARSIRRS